MADPIDPKATPSFDSTKSFVRSLCVGQIEEDILFPYPQMKEEEASMVRTLTDSLDTWLSKKEPEFRKWDVAGELPSEIVQEIRDMGLFGLIIPEEFGGIGLSTAAYSRCLQQMSGWDGSTTITAGAHSSIGMKGLLLFGNPEQKAKYLPKLATGEMIAAFCLTEAGAGSDAASIKTKAVRDGNDWILNGEKLWITNGGIADFFTVFATTDASEGGKMTAFIVTKDLNGVSAGPHEDKMGIRASSTTTIRLDNTRVPAANVLGEVGKGFKVAMSILNAGRTGLGGGSVGAMKKLISLSTKQAKLRKQFDRPISEFGLIKQKIGQMTIDCYASESVVNMVSGLIDGGYKDYAVEAAISKVFATECLWRTVDEGLQIAGGNGFMREFPYERIMRDCRINRIFEGANEILHLFIALTAMNDASSLLKDVGKMLGNPGTVFGDPIKGFGIFREYSKRWVSAQTGYGADKMTKVHPLLLAEQRIVETHTRYLAQLTDKLLRRHGKNIVEKQFATKRMALVIIDLYVLSCVLSRVTQAIEKNGQDAAAGEIEIAKTFGFQVDERIRLNAQRMDANEDEPLKSIADATLEKEKFAWDNI